MTKSELTAIAAEHAGIPKKDAERLLNAAIDIMASTLEKGEKVQLSGFGTFEVKHRQAKAGRDPRTKETIQIPAAKGPTFKPSKGLRDRVAK